MYRERETYIYIFKLVIKSSPLPRHLPVTLQRDGPAPGLHLSPQHVLVTGSYPKLPTVLNLGIYPEHL